MPDILTHYTISYLVASRILRLRYALLVALIGLLPDIDALFRVHRWTTHSLVPTTLIVIVIATAVTLLHTNQSYPKILALVFSLYVLHILLDVFTAPTPLLWPLTNQAYVLVVGINGAISINSIVLIPWIALVVEDVDFTPKSVLEGSIVIETGVIITIAVLALTMAESLAKRSGKR